MSKKNKKKNSDFQIPPEVAEALFDAILSPLRDGLRGQVVETREFKAPIIDTSEGTVYVLEMSNEVRLFIPFDAEPLMEMLIGVNTPGCFIKHSLEARTLRILQSDDGERLMVPVPWYFRVLLDHIPDAEGQEILTAAQARMERAIAHIQGDVQKGDTFEYV